MSTIAPELNDDLSPMAVPFPPGTGMVTAIAGAIIAVISLAGLFGSMLLS